MFSWRLVEKIRFVRCDHYELMFLREHCLLQEKSRCCKSSLKSFKLTACMTPSKINVFLSIHLNSQDEYDIFHMMIILISELICDFKDHNLKNERREWLMLSFNCMYFTYSWKEDTDDETPLLLNLVFFFLPASMTSLPWLFRLFHTEDCTKRVKKKCSKGYTNLCIREPQGRWGRKKLIRSARICAVLYLVVPSLLSLM